MEGNDPDRRPWFGPKRFGWGYSPQTWQGYLVTAGFVVVIAVIAVIAKGNAVPIIIAALAFVVIVRGLATRR